MMKLTLEMLQWMVQMKELRLIWFWSKINWLEIKLTKQMKGLPKGLIRRSIRQPPRSAESPVILGAEMGMHDCRTNFEGIYKHSYTFFLTLFYWIYNESLFLKKNEFMKQINSVPEPAKKRPSRLVESPLIIGAKMGLHDFVEQVLKVVCVCVYINCSAHLATPFWFT